MGCAQTGVHQNVGRSIAGSAGMYENLSAKHAPGQCESRQTDGYAAVKVNTVDRRRLDDGEEVASASATERRSDTFGVDSRNRRTLAAAVDQHSRVTPTRVQASTDRRIGAWTAAEL